jgi:hypothetical protein
MLPAGYLTELETGRYSGAYLRRLSLGLSAFRQWLSEHGPRGFLLARSHRRHVDGVLALFVDFCHSSELGFDLAKHAILAVQHMLQLKNHLPRAWNCMKAWKLELPITHRVPLPIEILMALFGFSLDCWLCGAGSSGLFLPMAILLRVAFFGLLRPGEVFGMKRMDVLLREVNPSESVAVLVIRRPKNRGSLGRRQFAVVRDTPTVMWLSWMISGLEPTANLWPSTSTRFRDLFRELVSIAGCGHLKLSPGCLRPGGTTWLFMQGHDISRIQFLGRWAALGSLQSYIQEAMGHLVWVALDEQQSAHIAAAISASKRAWNSPPLLPRASLPNQPRGWSNRRRQPMNVSPPVLTPYLTPLRTRPAAQATSA